MGSKRELRWWVKNAGEGLPTTFDDVWHTRVQEIHTDASGYGYGSTEGLWGLWEAEERDWIIAIKEMEAVRRQLCKMKPGTKARIGVDNTVVYWTLKRGRSFSWDLNNLIRRIGGDVKARHLEIDFEWIPTEENRADWVSRCKTRPQFASRYYL